jgi:hypothetical protein
VGCKGVNTNHYKREMREYDSQNVDIAIEKGLDDFCGKLQE